MIIKLLCCLDKKRQRGNERNKKKLCSPHSGSKCSVKFWQLQSETTLKESSKFKQKHSHNFYVGGEKQQ